MDNTVSSAANNPLRKLHQLVHSPFLELDSYTSGSDGEITISTEPVNSGNSSIVSNNGKGFINVVNNNNDNLPASRVIVNASELKPPKIRIGSRSKKQKLDASVQFNHAVIEQRHHDWLYKNPQDSGYCDNNEIYSKFTYCFQNKNNDNSNVPRLSINHDCHHGKYDHHHHHHHRVGSDVTITPTNSITTTAVKNDNNASNHYRNYSKDYIPYHRAEELKITKTISVSTTLTGYSSFDNNYPLPSNNNNNNNNDVENNYNKTDKRFASDYTRILPTLSVIPTQIPIVTTGLVGVQKSSTIHNNSHNRRSPPPMVPIESISSFKQSQTPSISITQLQDNNLIHRLKRLGTDVEVEKYEFNGCVVTSSASAVQIKSSAPSLTSAEQLFKNTTTANTMYAVSPASAIKPAVGGNKRCNKLPQLKPINVTSSGNFSFAAVKNQLPPNLIPINSQNDEEFLNINTPIFSHRQTSSRLISQISNDEQEDDNCFVMDKLEVTMEDELDANNSNNYNYDNGIVGNVNSSNINNNCVNNGNANNRGNVGNRANVMVNRVTTKIPPSTVTRRIIKQHEKIPACNILEWIRNKDDNNPQWLMDGVSLEKIKNLPSKKMPSFSIAGGSVGNPPVTMTSIGQTKRTNIQDTVMIPTTVLTVMANSTAAAAANSSSTSIDKSNNYFLFTDDLAVKCTKRSRNGQNYYKCDICTASHRLLINLQKHYYSDHINQKYIPQIDRDKIMEYVCDSSLWKGRQYGHKNLLPGLYCCCTCQVNFDKKNELKVHLLTHPSASSLTSGGGRSKNEEKCFDCPKCHTIFLQKNEFVQHTSSCKLPNTSVTPAVVNASTITADVTATSVSFDTTSSASVDFIPTFVPTISTGSPITTSIANDFTTDTTNTTTTATTSVVTVSDIDTITHIDDTIDVPTTTCLVSSNNEKMRESIDENEIIVENEPRSTTTNTIVTTDTIITSTDTTVTTTMTTAANTSAKTEEFVVSSLDDNESYEKLSINAISGNLLCLFCDHRFTDTFDRKKHTLQAHHPKRKRQNCCYCKISNIKSLGDLLTHLSENHGKKFLACIECKLRFTNKNTMNRHMTDAHSNNNNNTNNNNRTTNCYNQNDGEVDVINTDDKKNNYKKFNVKENYKKNNGACSTDGDSAKSNIGGNNNAGNSAGGAKKYKCTYCPRLFSNNIEMGKHRRKEHSGAASGAVIDVTGTTGTVKKNKKSSESNNFKNLGVKEIYHDNRKNCVRELLFYKNISHNVKINLLFFTNGKESSELLPGIGEVVPEQQFRAGFRDQRSTPTISDSRLHRSVRIDLYPGWEEDYFTLYQTRNTVNFWGLYGSDNVTSSFINNVSKLEFCTQVLIIRNKEAFLKSSPSRTSDVDMDTEELDEKATTIGQHEFLRIVGLTPTNNVDIIGDARKPAQDVITNDNEQAIFSGESILTKLYICASCPSSFKTKIEYDEHSLTKHPNVWCCPYEFRPDQTHQTDWEIATRRPLSYVGDSGIVVNFISSLIKNEKKQSTCCTKCGKVITPLAEFHKHMLECGGDTSWMVTNSRTFVRKNRRLKLFGSRRKRGMGRGHGLRRNIPTPVKPNPHSSTTGQATKYKKGGDADTIQKMIANLPPKRATRRAIAFDDIEISTRSKIQKTYKKKLIKIATSAATDKKCEDKIIRGKVKDGKPVVINKDERTSADVVSSDADWSLSTERTIAGKRKYDKKTSSSKMTVPKIRISKTGTSSTIIVEKTKKDAKKCRICLIVLRKKYSDLCSRCFRVKNNGLKTKLKKKRVNEFDDKTKDEPMDEEKDDQSQLQLQSQSSTDINDDSDCRNCKDSSSSNNKPILKDENNDDDSLREEAFNSRQMDDNGQAANFDANVSTNNNNNNNTNNSYNVDDNTVSGHDNNSIINDVSSNQTIKESETTTIKVDNEFRLNNEVFVSVTANGLLSSAAPFSSPFYNRSLSEPLSSSSSALSFLPMRDLYNNNNNNNKSGDLIVDSLIIKPETFVPNIDLKETFIDVDVNKYHRIIFENGSCSPSTDYSIRTADIVRSSISNLTSPKVLKTELLKEEEDGNNFGIFAKAGNNILYNIPTTIDCTKSSFVITDSGSCYNRDNTNNNNNYNTVVVNNITNSSGGSSIINKKKKFDVVRCKGCGIILEGGLKVNAFCPRCITIANGGNLKYLIRCRTCNIDFDGDPRLPPLCFNCTSEKVVNIPPLSINISRILSVCPNCDCHFENDTLTKLSANNGCARCVERNNAIISQFYTGDEINVLASSLYKIYSICDACRNEFENSCLNRKICDVCTRLEQKLSEDGKTTQSQTTNKIAVIVSCEICSNKFLDDSDNTVCRKCVDTSVLKTNKDESNRGVHLYGRTCAICKITFVTNNSCQRCCKRCLYTYFRYSVNLTTTSERSSTTNVNYLIQLSSALTADVGKPSENCAFCRLLQSGEITLRKFCQKCSTAKTTYNNQFIAIPSSPINQQALHQNITSNVVTNEASKKCLVCYKNFADGTDNSICPKCLTGNVKFPTTNVNNNNNNNNNTTSPVVESNSNETVTNNNNNNNVYALKLNNCGSNNNSNTKLIELNDRVKKNPEMKYTTNILLVCKGCNNGFQKVSSYKNHCELCKIRDKDVTVITATTVAATGNGSSSFDNNNGENLENIVTSSSSSSSSSRVPFEILESLVICPVTSDVNNETASNSNSNSNSSSNSNNNSNDNEKLFNSLSNATFNNYLFDAKDYHRLNDNSNSSFTNNGNLLNQFIPSVSNNNNNNSTTITANTNINTNNIVVVPNVITSKKRNKIPQKQSTPESIMNSIEMVIKKYCYGELLESEREETKQSQPSPPATTIIPSLSPSSKKIKRSLPSSANGSDENLVNDVIITTETKLYNSTDNECWEISTTGDGDNESIVNNQNSNGENVGINEDNLNTVTAINGNVTGESSPLRIKLKRNTTKNNNQSPINTRNNILSDNIDELDKNKVEKTAVPTSSKTKSIRRNSIFKTSAKNIFKKKLVRSKYRFNNNTNEDTSSAIREQNNNNEIINDHLKDDNDNIDRSDNDIKKETDVMTIAAEKRKRRTVCSLTFDELRRDELDKVLAERYIDRKVKRQAIQVPLAKEPLSSRLRQRNNAYKPWSIHWRNVEKPSSSSSNIVATSRKKRKCAATAPPLSINDEIDNRNSNDVVIAAGKKRISSDNSDERNCPAKRNRKSLSTDDNIVRRVNNDNNKAKSLRRKSPVDNDKNSNGISKNNGISRRSLRCRTTIGNDNYDVKSDGKSANYDDNLLTTMSTDDDGDDFKSIDDSGLLSGYTGSNVDVIVDALLNSNINLNVVVEELKGTGLTEEIMDVLVQQFGKVVNEQIVTKAAPNSLKTNDSDDNSVRDTLKCLFSKIRGKEWLMKSDRSRKKPVVSSPPEVKETHVADFKSSVNNFRKLLDKLKLANENKTKDGCNITSNKNDHADGVNKSLISESTFPSIQTEVPVNSDFVDDGVVQKEPNQASLSEQCSNRTISIGSNDSSSIYEQATTTEVVRGELEEKCDDIIPPPTRRLTRRTFAKKRKT